jgi:hypothetical protein
MENFPRPHPRLTTKLAAPGPMAAERQLASLVVRLPLSITWRDGDEGPLFL